MHSVPQLVLVTGLSGAGKSCALHYLEDLGFFWVDNLPLALIPEFLNHFESQNSDAGVSRVAVGAHIRDAACLKDFTSTLKQLRERVGRFEVLFMEASHNVLVTRYRATRRRHPVSLDHTIGEAVTKEAELLSPVRQVADHAIDTSAMTIPMLKDHLDLLYGNKSGSDLKVFLRSFGFSPIPIMIPSCAVLPGWINRCADTWKRMGKPWNF